MTKRTQRKQSAFDLGKKAFAAGVSRNDNPYKSDWRNRFWDLGWFKARQVKVVKEKLQKQEKGTLRKLLDKVA